MQGHTCIQTHCKHLYGSLGQARVGLLIPWTGLGSELDHPPLWSLVALRLEHKLKQSGSDVHSLNHSAGLRVAKHSIWLGQPGASSVYRTFSLWRLTQMSSSCVIVPYPNTSSTTSLNQLFDTLHSSFCPCLNPHLPHVDAVFQNWALLVPKLAQICLKPCYLTAVKFVFLPSMSSCVGVGTVPFGSLILMLLRVWWAGMLNRLNVQRVTLRVSVLLALNWKPKDKTDGTELQCFMVGENYTGAIQLKVLFSLRDWDKGNTFKKDESQCKGGIERGFLKI